MTKQSQMSLWMNAKYEWNFSLRNAHIRCLKVYLIPWPVILIQKMKVKFTIIYFPSVSNCLGVNLDKSILRFSKSCGYNKSYFL